MSELLSPPKAEFNPANICRITLPSGQYYLHHGHTISGYKILGFNEVDGAYNVLGMRPERHEDMVKRGNEFDQEGLKTVSQIPKSAGLIIDWY